MMRVKMNGSFSKTKKYLNDSVNGLHNLDVILNRYGEEGVAALKSGTPKDTGLTAGSWFYKISHSKNEAAISFHNSNIQNGVPIAIILQYGHGTGTGGYVEGIDYINPAIRPIFERITDNAWKEVNRL